MKTTHALRRAIAALSLAAVTLPALAQPIHRMGAKLQNLDACNGWTFWNVERADKLISIDDLRSQYREHLGTAA